MANKGVPANPEQPAILMKNILIADDEPELLEEWSEGLLRQGFEVVTCTDGKAVLPLLRAHPEIRIVVTDLRLPGLSGLELAKLAAKMEGPERGFILVSGHTSDSSLERLETKPFRTLLKKPVGIRKLVTTIEQVAELLETPGNSISREG